MNKNLIGTSNLDQTIKFVGQSIVINTKELLSEYATLYGIRYVVRNYEIDKTLISEIEKGSYDFLCDEFMSMSEIMFYQNSLLSKKNNTKIQSK
jgi:hypothetical protein